MPLKTAGSMGWNMWAPSMGLTFKTISTTCRETAKGGMRDTIKATPAKENPEFRKGAWKKVWKNMGPMTYTLNIDLNMGGANFVFIEASFYIEVKNCSKSCFNWGSWLTVCHFISYNNLKKSNIVQQPCKKSGQELWFMDNCSTKWTQPHLKDYS